MKTSSLLAPLALAMALAVPAQNAASQPYDGPPPPPSQYAPEQRPHVTFGYANVLRVTPVYDNYTTMEQQCDGPPQQVQKDTTGGTVLGAIIGGAIGNTVGKGDGRKAATIGGAVVGGAIGHNVAKNSDPQYVQGCRMVEVSHGGDAGPPVGFDVEYDYKGDVYVARMPYDPGNRIRVRVSVVPADAPPHYNR